jgi:hypothetical protein
MFYSYKKIIYSCIPERGGDKYQAIYPHNKTFCGNFLKESGFSGIFHRNDQKMLLVIPGWGI